MNNYLVLSLIIGIAALAVLFAVIAIYRNRGQKMETDYRTFFILGISFLPIGIATDNPGLWGMGIIFMVLGLVNRSKWREGSKWSEMDPTKRRIKLLVIGGLTALLLVTLLFYILAESN